MGINIDEIVLPAKGKSADGTRGFVFAAELGDEDKALLDEVRDDAREHGKIMTNVSLASGMVKALHAAYFRTEEPEEYVEE